MKKAIENAIYYTDTDLQNNIIINFDYTDNNEFKNILKKLHENIEVVATFGQKDNICYYIFNTLSDMYSELLLDKTTSIYIVNRKDITIKLNRTDNNEKSRIAVIKIDAVLSEYHPKTYTSYLFYVIALGTVGLGTFYLNK